MTGLPLGVAGDAFTVHSNIVTWLTPIALASSANVLAITSPLASSSGSGDEVRRLQFEEVEVTSMRSERALVTGMLVIPLIVVFVGWPAFAKWMVAPVADKPMPAPA